MNRQQFRERYGPCALVAGASVGLGAAFAGQLAGKGLDLVLLARRPGPLEELAGRLRGDHGVQVRTASVDLGARDALDRVREAIAGQEISLLVYNAAQPHIGPFLEQDLDELQRIVDVNCRGPVLLSHELGRAMARRGRGGILIMSSLAGSQGSPLIAAYSASKAFDLVLAESLWEELGRLGVDVLACRAGATITPGYLASQPARPRAPTMTADEVARQALAALPHGPSMVPGLPNRLIAFALGRLLPRRLVVTIMGRTARDMYGR